MHIHVCSVHACALNRWWELGQVGWWYLSRPGHAGWGVNCRRMLCRRAGGVEGGCCWQESVEQCWPGLELLHGREPLLKPTTKNDGIVPCNFNQRTKKNRCMHACMLGTRRNCFCCVCACGSRMHGDHGVIRIDYSYTGGMGVPAAATPFEAAGSSQRTGREAAPHGEGTPTSFLPWVNTQEEEGAPPLQPPRTSCGLHRHLAGRGGG